MDNHPLFADGSEEDDDEEEDEDDNAGEGGGGEKGGAGGGGNGHGKSSRGRLLQKKDSFTLHDQVEDEGRGLDDEGRDDH